ncbi:MAG: hypothetical protein RL492_794 [Verrucomicrobiota bacterium]|jgi:hypothetical protein
MASAGIIPSFATPNAWAAGCDNGLRPLGIEPVERM